MRISCVSSLPFKIVITSYSIHYTKLYDTGEVVGILNSDDQFYTNHALEQIAAAFEQTGADCTYGNLVYTNTEGKVVRSWKSRPYRPGLFARSWSPAHPTFYRNNFV